MENIYDIIIIGAGPAGLTAGLYASRNNYKTLILERGIYGGQMQQTGEIENYPAFTHITGPELSQKMYDQSIHFGSEYKYANVTGIVNEGPYKKVLAGKKEFLAKAVIIATGSSPRELGVEGESTYKGRGVSYCALCDGSFFRDKEVVVVGSGDSAVEEGNFLTTYANEVTILNRGENFRAQKILVDRALLNEKLKVEKFVEITEIVGDGNKVSKVILKNNQTNETFEKAVDGVFVYVGSIPNNEAFLDLPIFSDNNYISANNDLETSVEGIFAAGDILKKKIRQVATAVGDGVIASMSAQHYIENTKFE